MEIRRRSRVAVTGSTGLVGEALVSALRRAGFGVVRISRRPHPEPDSLEWDPDRGELDGARLEGIDAAVNLAGESIAGLRWTAEKKRAILDSRERGTLLLSRTLAELKSPPKTLVSASAVGYYGDRGDERLTESSGSGSGFLAGVCRRWEGATSVARALGIRTVHLRSGLVMSSLGGSLGTMLVPFRFGLGGRLGSGTQYLSWIDLDDIVGLILHVLGDSALRGPINATAPGPVTNATFTDVLGRVLRRPTLVPVPALVVQALLGEMGKELLLWGQRVFPERALASGYQFRFMDLEESLRHQLRRPVAEPPAAGRHEVGT